MEDSLLELKKSKKNILLQILKYTEGREFKSNEEDAQRYIKYIANRQVYFDKMAKIDEKINSLEKSSDCVYNEECEAIDREMKEIAQNIISYDKKNKESMDALMPLLQMKLRDSKMTSKIYSGYNTNPYESGGFRFDSKQ